MDYSEHTMIGTVGQDPGLIEKDDYKISTFSLATNKYNAKTQENITTWHNCVCFNKTADIVNRYVKKGSRLFVVGTPKHSKYKLDGETTQRTKTEVIINTIRLLDKKPKDEGSAYTTTASSTRDNSKTPF